MPSIEEECPDVLMGVPCMRGSVGKDPSWDRSWRVPEAERESALQPTIRTKTEEKRKALEVAIHSGEDPEKSMQVDGQEDRPHPG